MEKKDCKGEYIRDGYYWILLSGDNQEWIVGEFDSSDKKQPWYIVGNDRSFSRFDIADVGDRIERVT